jgi:hypothetical protein
MAKNNFDALDLTAELFVQLKQRPVWWKNILNDKELYVDIRKNNYVNVYYYGGSLAKIECKNGCIVAEIHEKYLGKNASLYEKLDLNSLTPEKITAIKENIKKNYVEKGDPKKPAEKKIQGKLILHNRKYIDSEFQYAKDAKIGNLRIDLIELNEGILSFVELKSITDNRLLHDETRNNEIPEIIDQMKKYEEFIKDYKDDLIAYYKKLLPLKKDLGLISDIPAFSINPKPKLLIVNTYAKSNTRRDNRMRKIKELLQVNKIEYQMLKYDEL